MDYSIVPITEQDKDRVLDFLYRFFFRDEPLLEYLQLLKTPSDRCKELEEYSLCSISQGLSLMAVDSKGKILGLRLNQLLTREDNSEKTPDHDNEIEECTSPEFKKVWKMLDEVYWKANVFKKYPDVNKVLGFKMLSVDSSCRRKGIAKALIEKTIALAKEHNIPLVRVDCTSAFSAQAMTSLGFDLILSLPYSQYLDNTGQPVFSPKQPHTTVQTFVKSTDSFS